MLKLAGEFEVGQEKIELISYSPGKQDTGDLEVATKTITAISEASGTGNADYSQALTLPKPNDARLVIERIAARLAVTIDSFDTATHLYCRVYVDQQDADHRLFDMDWDSTGAKLTAVDTHSGTLSVIFGSLKDGSAHTFYFFFWVNQANNAVISLVQLWEGVGTGDTGWQVICRLSHTGITWWNLQTGLQGSGSPDTLGSIYSSLVAQTFAKWTGNGIYQPTSGSPLFISPGTPRINMHGSVATDLNYISNTHIVLRSEQ